MTFEPRQLSPRAVLWTQVITWSVIFVFFAIELPVTGSEVVPTCPSVLRSLTGSGGIPATSAGLAFGITAIGFMWFLTGVLSWVYTRWPRGFLWIRVLTGQVMGPMARKAGIVVMAGGIVLGLILQVGCEIAG